MNGLLGLSRQSLWGVLLFLDSIFVIVFGGAVTMIASKHWQAPPPPGVMVKRRRPVAAKATETAAKLLQAPSTERTPEPLKTAAPAPASTPARTPASITASVPAAPASPVITPAAGKSKARGVVFKLHAPHARSVQIVGAFIVHGGRKDMVKGPDGTWTIKLYLNQGQYRYFFSIDKKKALDPGNPRSDRGASLLSIP